MAEDNRILVNWAEMRQSWLRSVSKRTTAKNVFKVRVLHTEMDYYGKLEVSTDRLTIIPDDEEVDARCFFDTHFRGGEPIIDDVKKVFRFQFNFKNATRAPLIMCVKSRDVLSQLETAVSELFEASTNYDSNEIVMMKADEPGDAPINL